MAGTKVCPNCGAKNPSSNRFCEDCGYDMNKASASSPTPSGPKAPLYCPNGHTVGDTSLGFCDVCGEKLTSVMPTPRAAESAPISNPVIDTPKPPVPPVHESHGKKCPSCGAMNPEDGVFCEECGASLAASTKPIPDEPKPIIHHAPVRELPEIPDIMRTLTNNDMKR